ncbi:hypothetical protein [Taibaiella soli]|uniref:DoxX family protein n=1 Tax=Taibaiella soli TaxID=1649169 RepID=A0A2W2C460_9BACT|nr:hypothetical protein [Taibaiella soli]PZF74913.1 hypothetical protein DN068_01575 [Taibaiella soli]
MILNKKDQNLGAIISAFAITLLLIYISFALFGFSDETTILSAIGISFFVSIITCLLLLRKYRKQNNPQMIDYLNIGTQRYILAILMIMYGIDKLLGNFFDYQLFAMDTKLMDVSEFELAWFFYGKNHWQELFTGIMEFVPALFLFRRRTYYIASLILLPVTGQVFLLNLFFKIGGITFPISIVLLACNLYLIYSEKEKILLFFRSLNFSFPTLTGKTKTAIKILKGIGIAFTCLIVFAKVRPAFFKSSYQKKYQELVGVYTLKEIKKNSTTYTPGRDSLCYKDLYIEKQDRWNILRKFNNETEAFVLKLNTRNDSISVFLNKGGIGDGPDIIDSSTALKGTYKLAGNDLLIKGIQQNDTLDLVYQKQNRIQPKKWFW